MKTLMVPHRLAASGVEGHDVAVERDAPVELPVDPAEHVDVLL